MIRISKLYRLPALAICLGLITPLAVAGGAKGLSQSAFDELEAAGVNKYLGEYTPVSSEDIGDGWVQHRFDAAAGHGPTCITGGNYSVYTRKGREPRKLLIMLQGGGACWQDAYACNLFAEEQAPPFPREGIWDFTDKANPFRKYSIVYMPYCDGSAFNGDNEVLDGNFPDGPIRYHRGLRNLSAGMDVARAVFPKPKKITVAGTSAGGIGAATLAPFLVRFQYGNTVKKLTVLNDAGPLVTNPLAAGAAAARAADWAFDQFFPASCTDCDALGQPAISFIRWRLANDSTVRDAFYSTDGDETGITFSSVNLPGSPPLAPFDPANGVVGLDQVSYRALLLQQHGELNAQFPDRYRRFIVSGAATHTAIQFPLFYEENGNGLPLNDWVSYFVNGKNKKWSDIVEDFQPLP